MEPVWETALLLVVFVAAKGACAGVALPLVITLLVWARAWFVRELPGFAGIAKAQEAARLQAKPAGTGKAKAAVRAQASVHAGEKDSDCAQSPLDKAQMQTRTRNENATRAGGEDVCTTATDAKPLNEAVEEAKAVAAKPVAAKSVDAESDDTKAIDAEVTGASVQASEVELARAAAPKDGAGSVRSETCPSSSVDEREPAAERADDGAAAASQDDAPDEVESQATDDWIHVTRESQLEDATQSKEIGNACFKRGEWADAIVRYQEAEGLAPEDAVELRKQCYGNRAACHLRLDDPEQAERDCTRALELDDTYLKVILRRADAREKLGKWQEAHDDLQKVVELDPSQQAPLRQRLAVLDAKARQKLEEDKAEMMGKLKDLGNTVLGKFGMSLNNFACEQDPATGSYSIQFKQ